MDDEDKKLLKEHSQRMADLQNDFQTFYKIVKAILPEIEHTKTLTRLEKSMNDSRKKMKVDLV